MRLVPPAVSLSSLSVYSPHHPRQPRPQGLVPAGRLVQGYAVVGDGIVVAAAA